MTSRRPFLLPAASALLLLLLLLRLSPVTPATEEEEELLLEFKGNVTADPGRALASWYAAPGRDPCSDFAGVTCGPSGDVEKVLIHSASLAGTLSAALAGLPSLQIISLFGNRFSGGIPPEFAALTTLHKLNLSKNELSGPVPPFLGDFPGLRLLDLSMNSFSGEIPENLFKNCFKTRFVSLSHNNLSGPIPSSIANCSNLVGFDFSFNSLTGEFLPEICEPPAINYVSLRNNLLTGTVADKVSRCHSLDLFDLGSNSFSGSVPFDLLALQNLTYFNVSSNKFQGQIPAIKTCSERLGHFDVSGNKLDGEIPSSIANCRGLKYLDLGSNDLSGGIPAEIGSLKSLNVLRLGNNAAIGGSIPPELAGAELLLVLDVENLQLSGEIPNALSQCRFLLELDLSGNRLQGEIPDTLYNITYLLYLDLHRNRLDGSIPTILGNLTKLKFLDLSENSLTGTIPDSLGDLTLLTYFNVSYNNLSGAIPSSPTIQHFGPSAFSHNPFLCGPPLDNSCSGGPSRRPRQLSTSTIVVIVAAAVILIGVCVVTAMNIRAYRKKRREEEEIPVSESTPPASTGSGVIIGKLVLFSKSLPSKYEDWEAGTKALLDKDCLVGGGSIGTVYRASFEGGVLIAVKKLETLGRIRNQDEFEQEMGRLGGLRHPNLVAFQGYYWSSTMQLILSEFIPNGSLYDHLHGSRITYSASSSSGGRGELFWSRRFDIALGTARALAYLHHDCRPQILHLNIKSTNILLDEGFEAKLADYGLGKLLPILGGHVLTKFHTAVGYVAPELASQSLRYSDRCDVYSFGVILLELATGRKPVDSPGAAEVVVLRDYVRGALEDGTASDCFDRNLRGFVETELIQVLKMGLICTSEDPLRRPSMAEVVQFLESIKTNS
ncbi:probable LRR receptor-like serine/threonine-protein kinase At1g12460 [Phoenix dactylifera]|uniref:Probable LRR receptor-like serine/threonine-protein kinase At1g12460 n=1 Tax=Phoenix dactylifera TaxID=42345 RepID=A0A8B9A7E9_PHODC|nr:probable LRR receptor-like serine/threonine-protein kinase At1g12460 [Phoenix dactylifera]